MSLEIAKEICGILHNANYEAYLIGGNVRDILLNVKPSDIDLTTNATPQQIKELFQSQGFKLYTIGEKFGTIAILKDNEKIEITTYRSETEYKDFRHPLTVKFETEIKEDLKRRDFTINAMALNPCNNELIDLFNGKEDLENHIIRCVGNANERFKEDSLRMLRAIRFSAKLNSIIETNTYNAIKENAMLIKEVAYERVKDELLKILSVKDCYFALEYLLSTGILNAIIPELSILKDVKQPKQFHKYNVLYHMFETVMSIPENKPLLRFCALIHDIGKTEMRLCSPYFPNHETKGTELFLNVIAPKFKFSNEETNYISFLISWHMSQFNFKNIINNKSALKRYLHRMGDNIRYLDDLFILFKADKEGTGIRDECLTFTVNKTYENFKEIMNNKEAIQIRDLAINGNDLIDLGVPKNETIGLILKELIDAVIEGTEQYKRAFELLVKAIIEREKETLSALAKL
jgi:tRNA nucleotidyltransferase (CCA-adding enzyme)